MTNKEMIDYAKDISVKHMDANYSPSVRVEAAKALALLIMAENETKLPNNIREVLD